MYIINYNISNIILLCTMYNIKILQSSYKIQTTSIWFGTRHELVSLELLLVTVQPPIVCTMCSAITEWRGCERYFFLSILFYFFSVIFLFCRYFCSFQETKRNTKFEASLSIYYK